VNGARAVIRTLVDAGVEVCFANPGTSEMHFVAALDDVPQMRAVLTLFEGVATGAADGYSSIEQEDFTPGDDLAETLAGIAWPDTVSGCVLALERAFLPTDAEGELPADPDAAALAVANHPRKLDLRVVVGVTRDGASHGLARVRGEDGDLLAGADLVPALAAAYPIGDDEGVADWGLHLLDKLDDKE
jgi:hypothetical protein